MRRLRFVTITALALGAGCAGDTGAQDGAGAALRAGEGEAEGRGPGRSSVVAFDAGIVLDCPRGPIGEIHVEFDCDAVTIYSCKDLSNVVLEYEDGERVRFEGLSGRSDVFGEDGRRIVRVWVKAGANFSGDGPGYGERFEAPEDSCDDDPPGGGEAGNGGDPLDPCAVPDPDPSCETPGEPADGEPSEEDEPGDDESGGEPLTCAEDPSAPACQLE